MDKNITEYFASSNWESIVAPNAVLIDEKNTLVHKFSLHKTHLENILISFKHKSELIIFTTKRLIIVKNTNKESQQKSIVYLMWKNLAQFELDFSQPSDITKSRSLRMHFIGYPPTLCMLFDNSVDIQRVRQVLSSVQIENSL